MSGQRVTSWVEARPCLANAALSVRWSPSASGRGKDLPGLFMLQGSATSIGDDASAILADAELCSRMTIHSSSPKSALIVGAERRKRAAQPRDARAADLLAWSARHRRGLPSRAAPAD